jgi:hypothetical protein
MSYLSKAPFETLNTKKEKVMKSCQNCDDLNKFDEYGHMSPLGKEACGLGKVPDKGKSYCQEWDNTTYDPLDGKEDGNADSYEEI